MSSEDQKDLLTVAIDESNSIVLERKLENDKLPPDSKRITEIGQGDVDLSCMEKKSGDLCATPTDKGDETNLVLGDENSDEDLHLKWDEDDEIEEDIISLHLPAEVGTDVKATYSTIEGVDIENTGKYEHQSQDNEIHMNSTDDTDKEIIDITDLSSPIPGEIEESQLNLENDSITKEEIKSINNQTNKDDEDTITIIDDIDEKIKTVKEEPKVDKLNITDDELIIIEDDIDDNGIDSKLNCNANNTIENEITNSIEIKKDVISNDENESFGNISVLEANSDHGLIKPDMMLEIPTQEIIDFIDDSDVSCSLNESMAVKDHDSKYKKEKRKSVDSVIEIDKDYIQESVVHVVDDIEESKNEKCELQSYLCNKNFKVLTEIHSVKTFENSNVEDLINSESLIQVSGNNKEATDSEITSSKISLPLDKKDTQQSDTVTGDLKQVIYNNDDESKQLKLVSIDKLQKPPTTLPEKIQLDIEVSHSAPTIKEISLSESDTDTTLPPSKSSKDDNDQVSPKSCDNIADSTIQSFSEDEKFASHSNSLVSPSDSTNNEQICKIQTSKQPIISSTFDMKTDETTFTAILNDNLPSTSEITIDKMSVPVTSKDEKISSKSEKIIEEKKAEAPYKNTNISITSEMNIDEQSAAPKDEQISSEIINVEKPQIITEVQEISSTTEKTIDDSFLPGVSRKQHTTTSEMVIGDQPSEQISRDNLITSTSETTNNEQYSVSEALSKGEQSLSTAEATNKITTSEINPELASTSQGNSKDEQLPYTSKTTNDVQPSTSQVTEVITEMSEQLAPDSKDEAPEVTDSLGLLAESSRVVEDDEEPDDEEEDEDDFDQDESSNQMTADHSEDSNAQHSETDASKDQDEKGTETPQEEKQEFNFDMSKSETGDTKGKDGEMVFDNDICEEVELMPEQLQGNEGDKTVTIENTEKDKETAVTDQAKDIEMVKSSNLDKEATTNESILRTILLEKMQNEITTQTVEKTLNSPNKKLEISQPSNILNFVDLEESSSEDDVEEVNKQPAGDSEVNATKVIDSSDIEVAAPDTASLDAPAPKVNRTTRINTSEVTIKTVPSAEVAEPTMIIPEAKLPDEKTKPKFSLEIFNLDSDDEDRPPAAAKLKRKRRNLSELDPTTTENVTAVQTENVRETNKCVNAHCSSDTNVSYFPADMATINFFDAARKRKAMVCEVCASRVIKRNESLVNGIKDFTPLLNLEVTKESSELVEISDSESEDGTDSTEDAQETLGKEGAAMLEEQLASMINETWCKFKMDARLNEAEDSLKKEMQQLEDESKEIDSLLNECQLATDKLRNELYATFECERHELPPLIVYDTPANKYSCLESIESTSAKRRLSSSSDSSAKRPAIPLGYTPLEHDTKETQALQQEKSPTPADTSATIAAPDNIKIDDDKDIAVLKVSAESAPSDLPPPGEPIKAPLKPGMMIYAMRNMFRSWVRSKIIECQGINNMPGSQFHNFTVCKVKIDNTKGRGLMKLLPARCLAYSEPSNARMTIGTRVIALFNSTEEAEKKKTFFSGIIAEVPNPVNNYRYLVFFDDGYAQYVRHADTRLVCECSPLVWEEVHPLSRQFVREYLVAYPERPMVRLHAGQSLKTEWNGKWWPSRVVEVDASLVKVYFEEDKRSEWIYRGSTRLAPLYLELQAAERHRARPMPRTKQPRVNMPYVEYIRSDEQNKSEETTPPAPQQTTEQRESRQRAVAKKSTATPQPQPPQPTPDNVISRVVYYTPKNAVKPYKMTAHSCGPQCKRSDVLALKDLRTYNPLAKPLLSGWERQIVRYKGHKEVMYRAPCGRRLRSMRELHRYLRAVHADMPVDLFDFAPGTHCLAEFVLNTCRVGKKDLSHGKENVPVPCVNYYDDSLPEFCSYNTERTPTAGVPLNLDPEFLCGCDCTDDCVDKKKCACWQMTLEGARTIGLQGPSVGYVYKRLPEPLPSGIYECNSRCKCKQTCLNRVAQHPLQLKLQVFKTLNRGWGIRALNDVPKGSFLCVYAGNLLTDATANMDGLNEGDEYLAELDYIEVVEQMKEGYEEDIPEADKKLDRKNLVHPDEEESEEESSPSEDENNSKLEEDDDDFRPPHIGTGVSEFNKRLRKRNRKKEKEDAGTKEKTKEDKSEQKGEEDCITISDDEEVREPSRFTAQAGMQSNEFISKYRSVRSHFGKDEACYIMDAKVQGNIGRYLNHSCQPNVFVQNVFVDTHDPRFPWVAFFALCHIKAGTELTWNYNYDVGSVPGKVLYCYCGAANCRGRLL